MNPRHDELADRGCCSPPPGTPLAGMVPLPCDEPPTPGQQRRRCHDEHLYQAMAGDQPGQRRQPQPVARLVADLADVPVQHRVLMPQHPAARPPWIPGVGLPPSGSRAGNARAGRRPERSSSDDLWPGRPPRQSRVTEPHRNVRGSGTTTKSPAPVSSLIPMPAPSAEKSMATACPVSKTNGPGLTSMPLPGVVREAPTVKVLEGWPRGRPPQRPTGVLFPKRPASDFATHDCCLCQVE